MSYWNVFDIGYNILERFHSDDTVLIKNQYNWDIYVVKKDETFISTYRKNLLNQLIKVFNNRIRTVDEFRILDFSQNYLCYNSIFLSDNEIAIGNEYSKWKYPTDSVLLINSNIIQVFSNDNIINKDDAVSENSSKLNFDTIQNFEVISKNGKQYFIWNHGCTTLTKQLGTLDGKKRFVFVNNNHQGHWNFLFGFYENPKDEILNSVKIYVLDSYRNENRDCNNSNSTSVSESDPRLVTLIKLIKLFVFVNQHKDDGKGSIILDTKSNLIHIHLKFQEKLRSLFSTNHVNYVYVTQQNDITSCGLHIVNYFHSVLKLIHKIESTQNSEFDADTFDTQLRALKSIKYHPKEYCQIRSDLLNFIVNFKFIHHIIQNKTVELFSSTEFPTEKMSLMMSDILSRNLIETANTDENKNSNEVMAHSVLDEINTFIQQLKDTNDNVKTCQCCVRFPKNKLHCLNHNRLEDDYPDIHQIPKEIVRNLFWTCPRFPQKVQNSKGAFYYKRTPHRGAPIEGINSIPALLKALGPQNPGYKRGRKDLSNEIKPTLLSRLSFDCLFRSAIIPDGGSCCEWIATSLVLSCNDDKEYFSYLNELRKQLKIGVLEFPQDAQEINKYLRMAYAFSITYEYDPYVNEYMNYPNDTDLNFNYCRNVLGYMKKFCSMESRTDNIIFQECCRNYYSLTPLQVGKYGCMWGQDDFLHWFQCVFNIRIFVINMDSNEVDGKIKITTTSNFVLHYQFQNSEEFNVEENYENDGIFDFNDQNKLIPYGIMIVLKEDLHYERLLIPYNQTSPLIPVGSSSVIHILPFMKISKKVWVSISVDNIKQHNKKVLDRKELDRNKELNYWYDYHVASEKIKQGTILAMPPLMEKAEHFQKHSVPQCSIKFYGFYVAMLCYLAAIRNSREQNKYIADREKYLIETSEHVNDDDKVLEMLMSDNEKLYKDNMLISGGDIFKADKIITHYENCFAKIKDEIYIKYLKENKKEAFSNITLYSLEEKRKNLVVTEDREELIENLASEGLVPNHLMLMKKIPVSNEKEKTLNAGKKVDIPSKAFEKIKVKKISSQKLKLRQRNELKIESTQSSDEKEIFENTSSTVGRQSPSNSSISSMSFGSHGRLSLDITSTVPELTQKTAASLKVEPNNTKSPRNFSINHSSYLASKNKSQTLSLKQSAQPKSNSTTQISNNKDSMMSGQSQKTIQNLNSKDSSSNNDLQSTNNKDSLIPSSKPTTIDIGKNTSNHSPDLASKNESQSSSLKNSVQPESNSTMLLDSSITSINKSLCKTSPSQSNFNTSKKILSDPHHAKEPVNVIVDKAKDNQSPTASKKLRKTSIDQTASSLGNKEQLKDSIHDVALGTTKKLLPDTIVDHPKTETATNDTKSSTNTTKLLTVAILTSPDNKEQTEDSMQLRAKTSTNDTKSLKLHIPIKTIRQRSPTTVINGDKSEGDGDDERNMEEDGSKNDELDNDDCNDNIAENNNPVNDSTEVKDPANETTEDEDSLVDTSEDERSKGDGGEDNSDEDNGVEVIDILKKIIKNMQFPLSFKFLKKPKTADSNAEVGIVWASIQDHQTSFANLDQFKFDDEGNYKKQTKEYLTQLVSHSKKICSFKRKQDGIFEGSYGFVGSYHYDLKDNWRSEYIPYHWQYLKTYQVERNNNYPYSRQNSMAFLRGNKNSKIIHHLSSIAWLSLSQFCVQHEKYGHLDIVEFVLTTLGTKLKGDDFIIEKDQKRNRRLIGSTPFTSLHITHWKNRKKFEALKRDNRDVLISVMLCFGPNEAYPENPRFSLPKKGGVPFRHNRVYIHFPQRDGELHILGNPKLFWLFTFQIDNSVRNYISNAKDDDWFQNVTVRTGRKFKATNIQFNPKLINNKKKRLYQDSETITLGYIDLIPKKKKDGNERSCLHDAFVNAGYMYDKNIQEELFRECPPKKFTNTKLSILLDSSVIKKNFHIKSKPNYTTEKGGNEWILLNNSIGTGLYIVWCYVHPTFSRKTAKRCKRKEKTQIESHAFVYDSDFNTFKGKKYYGAIIDNREHSYLRAFSAEDIKDKDSIRKCLAEYFKGKTIIRGWIEIIGKQTS